MAQSVASTRVTFPGGGTAACSSALAVLELAEGTGVITAETPFHPVDHAWPDQPADLGTVAVAGSTYGVVDCLTGAQRRAPTGHMSDSGVLLGTDIDARRGDPAWNWYVVHVVDAPVHDSLGWIGQQVSLEVDADRRARLSASHTACHLMAFALNEALAERWRKVASVDSLGNPNFDAVAITSSRISTDSSIDIYRLGKSLRKGGFTSAATDTHPSLADSLDALATALTSRLNGWIDTNALVRVDVPDASLTAPRRWVCDLPEGTATVLCGGTHVHRLADLGQVQVVATLNDDQTEFTIVTSLHPSSVREWH